MPDWDVGLAIFAAGYWLGILGGVLAMLFRAGRIDHE